jgi:hypothetical protein
MIFFVAPQAGRFAQRFGSRWPMTIGPILAGTGLLLMSRFGLTTPFTWMIPVLSMMGIGMGLTMAPMTAAVMNAVGPERAGLGSATTNTAREVGGTFGIALLGTLLTTQLRDSLGSAIATLGLTPGQQAAVVSSGGHLQLDAVTLQALAPEQARAVSDAFAAAFMNGFRLAGVVAAAFVISAGLVANRFIPGHAPQHDGETPEPARRVPTKKKGAPARPAGRTNGRKPAAKKPVARRKTTATRKSPKR